MKITIDTSQDSHDEIRKVIAMLKDLVGEVRTNYDPGYSGQSQDSQAPGIFSMFDSGTTLKEPETEEPPQGMFNMFGSVSETPTKDPKSTEGMFKIFETQPSDPKTEEPSSEEPNYQKLHLDEDSKDDGDDEYSYDLQTY